MNVFDLGFFNFLHSVHLRTYSNSVLQFVENVNITYYNYPSSKLTDLFITFQSVLEYTPRKNSDNKIRHGPKMVSLLIKSWNSIPTAMNIYISWPLIAYETMLHQVDFIPFFPTFLLNDIPFFYVVRFLLPQLALFLFYTIKLFPPFFQSPIFLLP